MRCCRRSRAQLSGGVRGQLLDSLQTRPNATPSGDGYAYVVALRESFQMIFRLYAAAINLWSSTVRGVLGAVVLLAPPRDFFFF